jgi:uncharacterized membrane protein YdjX (TVP38/TMEM64 family)
VMPPEWSGWLRLLPALAVLVLLGTVIMNGWHRLLTLDNAVGVRDQFQAFIVTNRMLALVAFVATYAGLVAVSLPGATICTLAGGLMFGWLIGGMASVVAATIGASLVFAIAQTALGDALVARAGPHLAKLRQGFQDNALSYMLFLRLAPAFPFCIVNVVPAILGVPYRTYLLGTLIGILPGTFAFSAIGASLDGVIMAAKANQATCLGQVTSCGLSIQISQLVTPELKIAFLLLSIVSLIPVALKMWRNRHGR